MPAGAGKQNLLEWEGVFTSRKVTFEMQIRGGPEVY
jgi:hypothetical protein